MHGKFYLEQPVGLTVFEVLKSGRYCTFLTSVPLRVPLFFSYNCTVPDDEQLRPKTCRSLGIKTLLLF